MGRADHRRVAACASSTTRRGRNHTAHDRDHTGRARDRRVGDSILGQPPSRSIRNSGCQTRPLSARAERAFGLELSLQSAPDRLALTWRLHHGGYIQSAPKIGTPSTPPRHFLPQHILDAGKRPSLLHDAAQENGATDPLWRKGHPSLAPNRSDVFDRIQRVAISRFRKGQHGPMLGTCFENAQAFIVFPGT